MRLGESWNVARGAWERGHEYLGIRLKQSIGVTSCISATLATPAINM